jgi:hypothetical protein
MKSLKRRLLMLCIGTILTLGLSHEVARASGGCADVIAGGNVYGTFDCRFDSSCGGSCYYLCTCPTLYWPQDHDCADVLIEAGFEIVEEIPCAD